MIIKSRIKNYNVNIVKDFSIIDNLIKEVDNSFFVIDQNLYSLYSDSLFQKIPHGNLFIFEAKESNKNIETVMEICRIITEFPAKRNIHLISIGGGIVQDVTGFVASILYRGIKWSYIPSTLLAACDSCIGSKTSLNYKDYKNLLGTFYPPDNIFICSELFNSLSDQDFKSGLGEVVKFNIMNGLQGLDNIESNIEQLLNRDKNTLDKLIEQCLSFKQKFIEEDEFDKNIRIHLNFAHTFGHAFESVSNYVIPHGTAVAIGIMVANRISLSRGYIEEKLVMRIESLLKKIINPIFLQKSFEIEEIINAIRKDKKQINSNLTGILLGKDMQLGIYHDLQQDEVEKAINYTIVYFST